jgi:hypothetical protein
VQLYNLVLQLRGLDEAWDDAELLIAKLGGKVIFGQDIRPSKWSDILRCFKSSCSEESLQNNLLQPSKLMQLLHCHLVQGTSESLRKIQELIYQHLEKKA